ncbi:MAG: APC family permease [Acidobacteria bacterium]|nr:APC family permease [Acidobacteriota bacterium]
MGNKDNAIVGLLAAEQSIEAHSAVFKKELGLTDLVLTQILFIVGLSWVGAAAKLGHSHIVFWLLAIVLFYIPSAMVVIYLNRLMPLEGGLYQWAKLGFNEFIGFLVAWNLWLYVIVLTSEIGLQVATYLSYALGPNAAWLASSKWFITLSACTVIGALVVVSTLGLGVGKWVHNAGALMMLIIFAALIVLPILNVWRGTLPEYRPFAIAMPAFTLFSLNILGKLGFGALGGFEYVAILAGECRNPVRTIGRSVMIAAPIIAVMFILGTSSVLAFIPDGNIDLIGPIPQVLNIGSRPFGIAANIVPVAILMVMCMRLAQASVNFTANSRLPMVAGWDHLLPEWFTRLHPKRKTPVNSILFVGAMMLGMGLAGIVGVGEQEAFQLLQSASIIFYGSTYLVMFAIPVIGLRGVESRPAFWLKVAAVSGFLMTLLNLTLSIFPIVEVKSQASFSAKVITVTVIANIVGATIFFLAERRRKGLSAKTVTAPAD